MTYCVVPCIHLMCAYVEYHFSDYSIILQFLFCVSLHTKKIIKKLVLSLLLADRNRYKDRLQRMQKF